jgi:chromosomal replication initiator protein
MGSVWETVKSSIKGLVPEHSFRMWIETLQFVHNEKNEFALACPNLFSKKRVQDYYGGLIESSLRQVTGTSCKLVLEVAPCGRSEESGPTPKQLAFPNMQGQLNSRNGLRPDFTFDQFVVGQNNGFAYSAARAMASQNGSQQNALFLLSKTGLGKSHLSQAVGNHILTKNPKESVFYMSAEDFTSEMVDAIQSNTIPAFKTKYHKRCDVLLLEDIHYLSGKERTQRELSATLDCMAGNGKKVILSSCCLPSEIPKLNDKLHSRLAGSLISVIEPPNFRTRVKILKRKAEANNFIIPNDVIHYLAGEIVDDVRQLENGLIGAATKASLLGIPLDFKLAEGIVKNIVKERKQITIGAIKQLVALHYKVAVKDLSAKSRKQAIVRPRQIAIYLSRRYTDQPLQEIGRSFNRYHATALHSIKAVEQGLHADGSIQKQVEILSKRLEEGRF